MPNKHLYFAMGALTGSTISWSIRKARFWLLEHTHWMKHLYRWNRDWFLYFLPCFVGFWGLIALTPDVLHGLNILPKEVTRSKIFNIFFFHSYFEKIEDSNLKLDQMLNWTGEFLLFFV